MQAIRRLFLASLFFTMTVLLSIWFFPEMANQLSNFNSNVQGGVGFGTDAYFWALYALDVGAALVCTSTIFYGATLLIKRSKPKPPVGASPVPLSPLIAAAGKQHTRRKQRLLLIPAWLVFQYVKNLFSGMSGVGAFEAMASIESLFFSAVVVAVVVLYANGYEVVFGSSVAKKPKSSQSAVETEK